MPEEAAPRLAVLTLCSGEPQLARCRESVAAQRGVSVEHVEFSGYGNRAAHQALHRFVEAEGARFDGFVKLDADMVFCADDAVARMWRHWREHGAGALQAEFPVQDVLGDIPIMGVHLYAAGARWSEADEALFVDPRPDNVLRRDKFPHWAPLVEHMPEPSLEQAFIYGFHRALKAFQYGRMVPNLWQMRAQWRLLAAAARACSREPTPGRQAMLIGAERASRTGRLDSDDYRDAAAACFEEAGISRRQDLAESARVAWRALRNRRVRRLPLDAMRAVPALADLARRRVRFGAG